MKPGAFRKTLLNIHLWMGALLAIPLILIGLSGSALLVQREILYLSVPHATKGKSQPVAAIVAAAQRALVAKTGGPKIDASWITFPEKSGRPASVEFDVSKRPRKTIVFYIDPVSLQPLGQPYEIVRRGPIMTMFTDMHEFLDMPSGFGLTFVGWMGIGTMLMALTGMMLWWPKRDHWANGQWKNNFLIRRGAWGLRLHLDLHHAIGIWGLPMFFLGLSGVYLTFPQSFGEVLDIVLPSRDEASPDLRPIPVAWPTSAEQAIQFARTVFPHARVAALQLPDEGGARYNVQMEREGWAPSFPPIAVSFDAREPGVMAIDNPANYPAAERFMNAQYSLHFAAGTGALWTLLVFLSGLTPTALATTGLTVWWKRRAARTRESGVLEPEMGFAPVSNA